MSLRAGSPQLVYSVLPFLSLCCCLSGLPAQFRQLQLQAVGTTNSSAWPTWRRDASQLFCASFVVHWCRFSADFAMIFTTCLLAAFLPLLLRFSGVSPRRSRATQCLSVLGPLFMCLATWTSVRPPSTERERIDQACSFITDDTGYVPRLQYLSGNGFCHYAYPRARSLGGVTRTVNMRRCPGARSR